MIRIRNHLRKIYPRALAMSASELDQAINTLLEKVTVEILLGDDRNSRESERSKGCDTIAVR